MSRERYQLVKGLLTSALDQEVQHRLAWLEQACGLDQDLHQEVLALLEGPDVDSQVFALEPSRKPDPELHFQGMRLGAWRLESPLGVGGMGSVWLASRDDGAFDMKAAVKLVQKDRCYPELIGRFRRERQILASLKHPNIAMLLDGGTTTDGRPYLVMEYVDGELVDRYCRRCQLGWVPLTELMLKLCRAVAYAHGQGVIHRDIKAANVMVTFSGQVKLMDFGIARFDRNVLTGDLALTRSGELMMTPECAAPEQLHGKPATEQTDIYTLGLLFLQLLHGHRPHLKDGDARARLAQLRNTSTSQGEPLPKELGDILGQCLAFDPASRFASADLMGHALEALLAQTPDPEQRNPQATRSGAGEHPEPQRADQDGSEQVAWQVQPFPNLYDTQPVRTPRRVRRLGRQILRFKYLARTWDTEHRDPDYLLRGKPLRQLHQLILSKDRGLTPLMRDYAREGLAEEERCQSEDQLRIQQLKTLQQTLARKTLWIAGLVLLATLLLCWNLLS